MNESILNPYTIIIVLSFLAVFVLVAFFIRKKSSSLKKIINNKKINNPGNPSLTNNINLLLIGGFS